MTTTLRILGWKSEGLRCPDHEIDLVGSQSHPSRVSLIQMPNGTGKTTTLELLRAALSGSLQGASDIGRFRKKDLEDEYGKFETRLQLDGRPLTMTLEFDFGLGVVDYKTTWASGQEREFAPPAPLHRFMNEAFVNFFIFDGELADDLLDSEKTDAGKAVESLFQVHLLAQMADKVREYWDRKTEGSAKDQKGLTRSRNNRSMWKERLRILEDRKQELKSSLDKINKQIEHQQQKYREAMARHVIREDRLKKKGEQVAELRGILAETTRSVLDEMRNPQALAPAFAQDMLTFKSSLDRVKLPESAAREWFEELSKEGECVCGRPIDESIREVIQDRAERYLGSDDIFLLNRIKSDISDSLGPSILQPTEELDKRIAELAEKSRNHLSANNELALLRQEANESDPAVRRASEEMSRLERRRDETQHELAKFQDDVENLPSDRLKRLAPEQTFSVSLAKKRVDDFEKEVAERTATLDLKRKRDILVRIIERARGQAKRAIANEIRDKTNERIAELMPNNSVQVDRVEDALMLRGQAGGSAGENLSIGYAFLATLFNRADHHQLPFVVDSPVVPIDGHIRPTIGSLLPRLTGQVVAFVISTEREGFLPSLERANDGEIRFITLFRRGSARLEEQVSTLPSGVAKTRDGCLVAGREFFINFQVESEETD